jgi:hypothetical protein
MVYSIANFRLTHCYRSFNSQIKRSRSVYQTAFGDFPYIINLLTIQHALQRQLCQRQRLFTEWFLRNQVRLLKYFGHGHQLCRAGTCLRRSSNAMRLSGSVSDPYF